jgi:hypothetical protein
MSMPEIYVAILLFITFAVIGIWLFRSPLKGQDEAQGPSCTMPPEYLALQQKLQRGEITREEFEEGLRRFSCSS